MNSGACEMPPDQGSDLYASAVPPKKKRERKKVDRFSETPLSDQLFDILRDEIVDQELYPYQTKLPFSEADLAEFHEISRVSVRRSLVRAETTNIQGETVIPGKGLIQGFKGRGWYSLWPIPEQNVRQYQKDK